MKQCPACFHENSDDAKVCGNSDCGYELSTEAYSGDTSIAPDPNTDSFKEGDLIADRYRVEGELGRGGMGVVYLVRDAELMDRQVALKMMHPRLVEHPEALQRFRDEVSICLDLLHTNIVRVNDIGEWQNLRFFTMEFIAGQSLRWWLNRRSNRTPPFSMEEVISVVDPLLDALAYAHRFTVHRDIKPENIIVSGKFPDISIKVLDFGIAKTLSISRFTQTAQSMGTAYYMAPEQMAGTKVDQRADLYSVGMLLYEMLTGKMAVGRFALPGELVSSYPDDIDNIVVKALAPEAKDRFQDAAEMKATFSAENPETIVLKRKEQQESQKKKEQLNACFHSALMAYNGRKWEEAGTFLKELLKLDPDHDEAKQLYSKASANTAQLGKLIQRLDGVEKSEDYVSALKLLEEIVPLSADRKSILEKKTGIERQIQDKKRIEAEKRQREEEKKKRKAARFEEERKEREEEAKQREQKRQESERKQREADTLKGEQEKRKQAKPRKVPKKKSHSGRYAIGIMLLVIVSAGIYWFQRDRITEPKEWRHPEEWRHPVTGMEFVWVPEGCFEMGCGPWSGDCADDEKPVHEVCLDGIWMGKSEVTQAEWKRVMANNPSHFKKGDSYPVEMISWNDTQKFIRTLNRENQGKFNFRLPTEAEWEYTARSRGKTERYSGGNDPDRLAWHRGNSKYKTHSTRLKSSNGLGIYDMSGNVWEWCQDVYSADAYRNHKRKNPSKTGGGTKHVIRGGSWNSKGRLLRVSNRHKDSPFYKNNNLGLRLVRTR